MCIGWALAWSPASPRGWVGEGGEHGGWSTGRPCEKEGAVAGVQLLRNLGKPGHVHGVSNLGSLLMFQRAALMEQQSWKADGSQWKEAQKEAGTAVCGGGL